MTRATPTREATTYFPQGGEIIDFMRALEERGIAAPDTRAALVGPDDSRVELPESIHRVVLQVAESLMAGMPVTVTPQNAMLTTQEAADHLGVSRPTLVRMLEAGRIPMVRPGRHRFVQLRDLVEYQEREQRTRRDVLDRMALEAEAAGIYGATDGVPPAMR